jgi:hypothetical protein
MRNAKFYGVEKPVWQPDNWLGERTFLEMLKEAGVELRINAPLIFLKAVLVSLLIYSAI